MLVMGANPFKGETLAPMGLLGEYPGWSSHSFSSPRSHPERSDILDGFLPGWISSKNLIRNDHAGFAELARAISSPGMLGLAGAKLTPEFLVFLATEDDWLGFYFASLVKLVVAATGGFLFLRMFLGAFPAFWGGAIFALCGFNAAWFHWQHVMTSGWIPWVLWACAGWYLYRRKRWLLGIVVTTAMLILGGFPAVAAYGLGAVVLLAAVLSFSYTDHLRDALKMGGLVLTAIAAGFLLDSIPLLALSETISQTDISYRQGGTRLDFPGDLALLMNPFADGLPTVERTLSAGWIALLFALAAPFLARGIGRSNKAMVLPWYGTILLVASIAVTFGLIPHALLKVIPVVGGSLWSRFSVIIGLSIAVLAAFAVDQLLTRIRQQNQSRVRALAMTCLAALGGYQLYSQAVLFRTFNSVAVAEDFYPVTPTIKYVTGNLGVTQSVVADDGFLIGGTLRAYGIQEWFAHGFKSNAEKATLQQLVDKPYKTATSAMFPASAIKLNGDLYARLGIRYVLMSHGKYKIIHRQPPLERKTTPAVPQNRLVQSVLIDRPMSVSAVSLVFDTFGAKQAPADVFLELRDSGGRVIARSMVVAAQVQDKRRAFFRFKENVDLSAGTYELQVVLAENANGQRLGVLYSGKVQHPGDVMRINSNVTPGAMLYTLYGDADQIPFDPAWWRLADVNEEKITTLENLRTPKGAYLLRDLSATSPWTEDDIVTSRPHAKRVNVHYSGKNSGYIIVPVRFYPGWTVYVNGAQHSAQTYLGMLSAIKVEGPSEIVLAYEPEYISKGGLMTLGVLPLLILLLHFAGSCRPQQVNQANKNT